MTKAQKIDLLYRKAKGDEHAWTPEEYKELKKYKVSVNDGGTKASMREYVTVVDEGKCTCDYFTYIKNHGLGDKRRREGRPEAIKQETRTHTIANIGVGFITWGICIGLIVPSGAAFVIGGLIAGYIAIRHREWAMAINVVVPIVLAAIIGAIFLK